jgi:DNA ligase (NAD+)
MNTLTIKELVEKLIEAKERYYQGNPIMDDFTFDNYEDQLRQLDPGNDYFKVVGSPIQGNIKMKIKHQFPMLSMAKGKSINDIEKWLNKISDRRLQIIIEPKIDGLSFTAVYENEKLQHIATRGDGTTGQIITHIAEYVDIPKTIDVLQRVEVRGELYLPKNCKVDNPNNSPLRNVAVGLINRKDSGLEDLKHIKYISYQVIGTDMTTEEGKIKWLRSLGFTTVSYNLVGSIKEIEEYFQTYKETGRDNWLFETDGLILAVNDCKLHESINSKYVVSHHWMHNLAWKPEAIMQKTKLLGINWEVSKNGNVIPTAFFEPIFILNREIKNASLSNYKNVIKMKLEIEDELLVSLSNDVIPYIEENITKGVKQR